MAKRTADWHCPWRAIEKHRRKTPQEEQTLDDCGTMSSTTERLKFVSGENSGTPFSKSNAKNKIIISTLYEAPKMFSPPYCLFFTNVQRLLLLVKEIKTALLDWIFIYLCIGQNVRTPTNTSPCVTIGVGDSNSTSMSSSSSSSSCGFPQRSL